MKTIVLHLLCMLLCLPSAYNQVNIADSMAMINFYYDLNGDDWIDNSNWLTTTPMEQWSGIEFNNGRLVAIDMKNNNLTGIIGESLNQCTELQQLFILENNISGIADLDSFHQMKFINLSTNKLSEFPSFITKCKNLEKLNLYDNSIEGNIPTALNNLTQLKELVLSQNQLDGSAVSLKNLKLLTEYDVSINRALTGSLQDILYDTLQLEILSISYTKISGELQSTHFNEDVSLRIFADSSQIEEIDQIQNYDISRIWLRHTNLGFHQLRSILDQNNIGQYYFNPQNDVPGPPAISTTPGMDIVISCLVEGAESLQWYKNGFPLQDENANTLEIANVEMVHEGAYHCSGTHEDLPGLQIHQTPTTLTVGTTHTQDLKERHIAVYPNPASECIIIDLENLSNHVYHVYNHVGTLVQKGRLQSHKIRIDQLLPGKYTLIIVDSDQANIKASFIKI